jgi:hypothetical protein
MIAPSQIAGMTVHEEQKAAATYANGAKDKSVIVSNGRVLSMSRDGLIQAALQVAQLKPGYRSSDPEVVRAITKSLGKVKPLRNEGPHALFSLDDGSQRIYLWFPTSSSMALLVVRSQIPAGAAEALARSLIGYGDGVPIDEQALDAAFASVLPVSPSAPPIVAPPPTASPSSSSKGSH